MKNSIPTSLFLLTLLFLTGCEKPISEINKSPTTMANIINQAADKTTTSIIGETVIKLADNATVVNSDSVIVAGDIITITKEGNYMFSGELSDGQIVVDAPEFEVIITLNNVDINSDSGPAIYVQAAKDIDIILAENSVNYLTDGEDYSKTEDNLNGVIFSTADLKIKGEDSSSLLIEGLYKDGIVSKDDLTIKKADIAIIAEDDGIRGKDSVTVEKSTLIIDVGGDGIKSDNSEEEGRGVITLSESDIEIIAGDDGIHGVQVINIMSGNIDILESYEGIEGKVIMINDGVINIVSKDDGLNVAEKKEITESGNRGGRGGGMNSVLEGGLLTINGGTITMDTGGDGFDSNGNAVMTGGVLIVNGPTNSGNGPLDVNGTFLVSGGTIIAVGSSGMAETPSETSSQYSIQVNFEEMQDAGSQVSLQDESGREIFSFEPEKEFQSVTYSSNEIQKGRTYDFLINDEIYTTLEISEVITKYGEGSRMGGGGGGFGGGRGMDLPENWDDMTEDEQHTYKEENRPEGMNRGGREEGERGTPPGMELPENWETMTEDERQEYMESNRPEGMEPPQ